MNGDIMYSVTDFIAICNQVFDTAFGSVVLTGELSQFKVSKNRWVYFDLKDEYSSLRFFGTVYSLPGPLEDGMVLTVRGVPQLHNKFGFSVNVQSIQLAGEGTIKKASQLLEAKLEKEGLFAPERKRPVPYPPQTIGLIASAESAGYADFIKILNERWSGVDIRLLDVHVQGEKAPAQISKAVQYFNSHAETPDVLVIIRGGGSADDLQAFSSEGVVRAVAASRIPTVVAIGHEIDVSLAERAADLHASTPSNAAQLLVPDKRVVRDQLKYTHEVLDQHVSRAISEARTSIHSQTTDLTRVISQWLQDLQHECKLRSQVLLTLSPTAALRRGYAVLRSGGKVISSVSAVTVGQNVEVQLQDGDLQANVTGVTPKKTKNEAPV